MARDTWFETVAIAQQRAKKRLPKSAYSSLISASEKGVTVSDNVESFGELGFAPHVIGAPTVDIHGGPVPSQLINEFIVASLVATGAFWLVLGAMSGHLARRRADEH